MSYTDILYEIDGPIATITLKLKGRYKHLKTTISCHPVRDAARKCCFADTGPRLPNCKSKLGPGCRASSSIALAIELSLGSGMTLIV